MVISEQKGNCDQSNIRERYNGLGLAIHPQSNNRRDQVYLEPVDSYKAHNDEFADPDSNETSSL